MKAISLWQPWATLVVRGIKTIETRTHGQFKSLEGRIVAIHAAKKYDKVGAVKIRRYFGVTVPFEPPQGAIVGTVRVGKVSRFDALIDHRLDKGTSKWHRGSLLSELRGRWGMLLYDANEFDEPIPFKGRQGIFNVVLP